MSAPSPDVATLGDRALVLRFGDTIGAATTTRVLAARRRLADAAIPGVVDLVPAYTTLTVHYDWQSLPGDARDEPWLWLTMAVGSALDAGGDSVAVTGARQIELPVVYGGDAGPDLDALADECGLTADEIIERHSAAAYTVAFLGFRPGFPYLLGLDPALAAARLPTPRSHVPAGSVGIAGAQTGVYPAAGPGGWRIIGRTTKALFDPAADPPSLLAPGDRLRFVPVDPADAEPTHDAGTGDEPGDPADHAGDIEVLSPGIHTSVQDLGRRGWRHLGIGAGGACDTIAATLANAMVGNAPDAAVLEMTLRGPELRFAVDAVIALAGDGMDAFTDGDAIPFARPVALRAGTTLSFRATGTGARAWLAIAGGVDAPRWLGSASAEFGSGIFGRAVRAGNRISIGPSRAAAAQLPAGRHWQAASWWVDARAEIDSPMILRFVADAGAGGDLLRALTAQVWRASAAADRRGVRMEGRPLDVPPGAGRGISAGVVQGTIQLPPDGQPILLGPDCQTTGGYTVAGHVIEADLPRLAQLKPGDLAWLQPVSIDEAHAARRVQATSLRRLQVAISAKLRVTAH